VHAGAAGAGEAGFDVARLHALLAARLGAGGGGGAEEALERVMVSRAFGLEGLVEAIVEERGRGGEVEEEEEEQGAGLVLVDGFAAAAAGTRAGGYAACEFFFFFFHRLLSFSLHGLTSE
jgi:hypothetical protein